MTTQPAATESTITCPFCGEQARETLPDACVIAYRCTGCGETLRPAPGTSCVFCTYGDAECCPPGQAA